MTTGSASPMLHWLRLGAGGVAGVLALVLAFEVGRDAGPLLFGETDPPARAPSPLALHPAPAATPGFAMAAPAPAPAAPLPAPTETAAFTVRSILPITEPIRFGQWYWKPEAGPVTGPLVITVDLAARVLSVWRDGHEIGTTAILKGWTDKPTPLGVFPILGKDADHASNLYADAPMPYTLRLTNDGVSIHGDPVQNGYATNGCVGVPTPFAKLLFGAAKVGDRVVITDGRTMTLGDTIATRGGGKPRG